MMPGLVYEDVNEDAKGSPIPRCMAADHDIGAAVEHRMNLAVCQLRVIGCRASGFISDDDLVTAVRAETRRHRYHEVILATGRQRGTWLARTLWRDPAHRLRQRLGRRLVVFPLEEAPPGLLLGIAGR
jgi:hypothetical protein